jgi:hypothetical protein
MKAREVKAMEGGLQDDFNFISIAEHVLQIKHGHGKSTPSTALA